jgi:hypothetical protein
MTANAMVMANAWTMLVNACHIMLGHIARRLSLTMISKIAQIHLVGGMVDVMSVYAAAMQDGVELLAMCKLCAKLIAILQEEPAKMVFAFATLDGVVRHAQTVYACISAGVTVCATMALAFVQMVGRVTSVRSG